MLSEVLMRLTMTKSKNSTNFYIIESAYINGKPTLKTVEKLGNLEEIKERKHIDDPIACAKIYLAKLNAVKTDFKTRPAYLQRNDGIKAHFLTCFLSLILYRYYRI